MRVPILLLLLLQSPADLSTLADEFVSKVTCVATSRQVPGYLDEKFLVSDDDMTESPVGSGQWIVGRKARAWNSGYGVVNGRNDESPIVEFRFEQPVSVSGLHVWNMPGPRGFHTVTVQYSQNDDDWQFLPDVLTFAAAPEDGEFRGERIMFSRVLRARKLRLWCHGTHRGRFGQPDVAGLVRVRFVQSERPAAAGGHGPGEGTFPPDSGMVNVQSSPYFAKGDGQTDDTAAIQQAMNDCQATRRYVYLPRGTYLISKTLEFRPGVFFGDNNIRGDGAGRTVLRLKDHTFNEAETPQSVLTFGYHGSPDGGRVSADWFNNNIRDLTIDVGNNPGAIGLQYYSNNAGAARNLEIRAAAGAGVIGLDLGYQDQNGPLLVKDVSIHGFEIGVSAGNSVNSQTLSRMTLRDQRSLAVRNTGQCLTMEGLDARGPSPRIDSKWGFLTLVDAMLACEPARTETALTSGEFVCAVNLRTEGFGKSIVSTYPHPREASGVVVGEFFSASVTRSDTPDSNTPDNDKPDSDIPDSDFSDKGSFLMRKMTPTTFLPHDAESKPLRWVNVRNFRSIDETDDAAALQRAIDSGADGVYIPAIGQLVIGSTVTIRGRVSSIAGFQSQFQVLSGDEPAFRIQELESPQLVIEGLIDMARVENHSASTIIMRDIQGVDGWLAGSGEVFLENTVGDFEVGPRQRVWSRQMNSERAGTKLVNRGGHLVIIGLKTERGGTLVETTDGGVTQVFGGLCYTTNKGELAPMFVNRDSSVWVAMGEVCYTGNPFRVLVREERDGKIREWKRGEVPKRFDFLQGSALQYDGRR